MKRLKKKVLLILALALAGLVSLTGCGGAENGDVHESQNNTKRETTVNGTDQAEKESESGKEAASAATELEVRFGYDGDPYTLHLYENETAHTIAKDVGTVDWNLPIYHYDDYENYEVMQYYDIPSKYEIPSVPETVTSEKAGEVYYSDPNRIILFYQDAQVTGEYTKIGYIDYSDEFLEAVENNPVLEGWGNKIVSVSPKHE